MANDGYVSKPFLEYQMPLYVCIICIFALSTIPDSSLPYMGSSSQKRLGLNTVAHLVEYGVLCFLLFRFFQFPARRTKRTSAILAVLCAAVLGGVDEFYQNFTGRYPSIYDWFINCVGAVVSILLVIYIIPYVRARKTKR